MLYTEIDLLRDDWIFAHRQGLDLARLEELTRDAHVQGVIPNEAVQVIDVEWHGSHGVALVYRDRVAVRATALQLTITTVGCCSQAVP